MSQRLAGESQKRRRGQSSRRGVSKRLWRRCGISRGQASHSRGEIWRVEESVKGVAEASRERAGEDCPSGMPDGCRLFCSFMLVPMPGSGGMCQGDLFGARLRSATLSYAQIACAELLTRLTRFGGSLGHVFLGRSFQGPL